MSLVFAGICSHAPGITGRGHMADPTITEEFYRAYRSMADELAAVKPDVLVIVAAEHFAERSKSRRDRCPRRVFRALEKGPRCDVEASHGNRRDVRGSRRGKR